MAGGPSYYLSSHVSGVATIGISSYLVHQGVDIGAYLSDWGVGESLGEAAGTAAAAAMGNIGFVPLHFYASVYGVRGLEGMLKAASKGIVDGKLEAERDFRRDYERDDEGDEERSEDGSRESEYERMSDGMMKSATLLLLMYSVMVSLYSFRLVGKKVIASDSGDDGVDDRKGQDVSSD